MKKPCDHHGYLHEDSGKIKKLTMRCSLMLTFFVLFQLSAKPIFSQDQIEFEYQKVALEKILNEIKRQSGFRFFYNANEINDTQKITFRARKEPLTKVLQRLSKIAKFNFKIIEKQVVLTKKSKPTAAKQTYEISGVVEDKNGTPLPAANVLIVGTSIGTQTDFDGNFILESSDKIERIMVSFMGFKTEQVEISDQEFITVVLQENNNSLDAVLVTALGISREKKSLGYSVGEVDGDEVSEVKDANFVNSLAGKVAGVNIKASGTMGGSTNVVIRGYSSLTGNNQALFVVDGTPINNNNNNSVAQASGQGGYDFGNAASDINPDDIASISVLKGAAATALYGSRGSNGVILITTKKGSKDDGMKLSLSSSVIIGNPDKTTLPKYQTEYGSGTNGQFIPFDFDASRPDRFFNDGDPNTFDVLTSSPSNISLGPRFDSNQSIYQWDSFYPQLESYGQPRPWVAGANTPEEFLETAVTTIVGVNVQGGDEKNTFRLGYTNFNQKGLLPNSKLEKNTITFSGSRQFTDKFTGSTSISFVKQNTLGRTGTGYEPRSTFMNFRQWWQISTDILQLRDLYFSTRQNITNNPRSATDLAPFWFNNPYFERYENFTTDERSRYFGNITLDYKITNDLNVTGNVSFDTYDENIEERLAVGSSRVPNYARYDGDISEFNYNFMVNYSKALHPDFSLDASLGYNLRVNEWDQLRQRTNGGLGIPGLYSLANSVDPLQNPELEYLATKKVESVFGRASLGYKGLLYLDLTYRQDRSSTLPVSNNTYGYPSISTSLIFSKLIDIPGLDFGKIRANYAEVGNDVDPFRTNPNFILQTPFNGNGSALANEELNNSDLKEERTSSYEVGAELNFLKKRVGLDISYYYNKTEDLLTPVNVSRATGVTSRFANAGAMENKGLEVLLTLKPIQTDDFNWDVSVNWSKNRNTVLELSNNLENLQLAIIGGRTGVTINATPGQPYGTIRGTNYVFHENGQRIVNGVNHSNGGNNIAGGYQISDSQTEVIGNIQADWTGGIKNKFTYKNLGLSFSVDMQKGGDIFAADLAFGYATGIYRETAGLNELGNELRAPVDQGGGVLFAGVDTNGNPNTVRGPVNNFGNGNVLGYLGAPAAYHIYDASFIKLREASLSYNLPESLLKKLPVSKVTAAVTGKNLWIIHKNLPHSDPEAGQSAGNIQGFQSGVSPTLREFGFSLNVEF